MNSVSPTDVSAGMLDDFASAFWERMARDIGRLGRPDYPDEAADVIIYLASPESAWIKGQDVVVDAGLSALALSGAQELSDIAGSGP